MTDVINQMARAINPTAFDGSIYDVRLEYRALANQRIARHQATAALAAYKRSDEYQALIAENARIREALAFYADPDSYKNFPTDQARARNNGSDPITYHSSIGRAPPGCALSDVQLDKHGDKARAALTTGGTDVLP